ncbi:hypothetical protein DSO57_1021318 [Entomophthora muscae]|uniref:Uncharacterized protein n=1 Tax=Entomophthora muscae TaxID=34485 RepID=A0ACC2T3K1_9FUNG|nr:hypothetical protein DSO57_1021318 [Entomophthora muscae]
MKYLLCIASLSVLIQALPTFSNFKLGSYNPNVKYRDGNGKNTGGMTIQGVEETLIDAPLDDGETFGDDEELGMEDYEE